MFPWFQQGFVQSVSSVYFHRHTHTDTCIYAQLKFLKYVFNRDNCCPLVSRSWFLLFLNHSTWRKFVTKCVCSMPKHNNTVSGLLGAGLREQAKR